MRVPQLQIVLAALVTQMEATATHLTHFAIALLLVHLAQLTRTVAISTVTMAFAQAHGPKEVFVMEMSVLQDTIVKRSVHIGGIVTAQVKQTYYK